MYKYLYIHHADLAAFQIDFDKLAPMCGYTVGSAKVTFGKLKRKMKAHAAGEPNPTTPRKTAASGTPKSTGKRKGAGAAGSRASPSKKAKGNSVKQEDDEEEMKDLRIYKNETDDLLAGASKYLKPSEDYDDDEAQGKS